MPNRATLVPEQPSDVTVYLVLDDFGDHGRHWRETSENEIDEATVIDNLITGHYRSPARIIAFNTAEGWARDVSEDVARSAIQVAIKTGRTISPAAQEFYEWMTGEDVPADVV